MYINEDTFRAVLPLPECRSCNKLARPNVLMFDDFGWNGKRGSNQRRAYKNWVKTFNPDEKIVVVEVGAGTAVSTVRMESESYLVGTLIRINLRDTEAPEGAIVLPMGGKDALTKIDHWLQTLQ